MTPYPSLTLSSQVDYRSIVSSAQLTLYITGAYCSYDNNESYVSTNGRLYNWYVVDNSRGLASNGWHVPTDEEWKELEVLLGMSQSKVDKMGWRGTD